MGTCVLREKRCEAGSSGAHARESGQPVKEQPVQSPGPTAGSESAVVAGVYRLWGSWTAEIQV